MKAEDPSETAYAMLMACALRQRVMYHLLNLLRIVCGIMQLQVLSLYGTPHALDGVGFSGRHAAGGVAAAVACLLAPLQSSNVVIREQYPCETFA